MVTKIQQEFFLNIPVKYNFSRHFTTNNKKLAASVNEPWKSSQTQSKKVVQLMVQWIYGHLAWSIEINKVQRCNEPQS